MGFRKRSMARRRELRSTFRSPLCARAKVNWQFHAQHANVLWLSGFCMPQQAARERGKSSAIGLREQVATPRAARVKSLGCERYGKGSVRRQARDRRSFQRNSLIHPSDCWRQHVSARFIGCPTEAGIEPSAGGAGDSDDNALTGALNDLPKTDLIRQRDLWRGHEATEFAMLEWMDCFNHCGFLDVMGDILTAEANVRNYEQSRLLSMAACHKLSRIREIRSSSLHANLHVLAQSGRALVRDPASMQNPSRSIREYQTIDYADRHLHQKLQQQCLPSPLDRHSR